MNKKPLLIIIALVMTIITINSASAGTEFIDFESGKAGFTDITTGCTINTGSKISGTNSLAVDSLPSAGDVCHKTINITEFLSIIVYMELDVYYNFHSLNVGNYEGTTWTSVARCMSYTDNKYYCYDKTTTTWISTGVTINEDTTYKINYQMDNLTNTWDIYINDDLKLSGLPYENEVDVNVLRLGGSTNGPSYYDNITITTSEPVIENFSITAIDSINKNTINSFSATINETTYTTTTGIINTTIPETETNLFNVNISSEGYTTKWYYNQNMAYDLEAQLTAGPIINLYFINNTGYANTEGKISRESALPFNDIQFNGTNISKYLTNLVDDKVVVYLGNLTTDIYKQQYQFQNNLSPSISENISIINHTNGYFFVQVLNEGGGPIKEAIVRVYSDDPNNNTLGSVPKPFIGQYITGNDGLTDEIKVNTDSIVEISATKEGYSYQRSASFLVNTYNTSKKEITLTDSNAIHFGLTKIMVSRQFNNRSRDIYGTIYSPSSEIVTIQTTWREIFNVSEKQELTEENPMNYYTRNYWEYTIDEYPIINEEDVWNFKLSPNEHFSNSTSENINLSVYIDGVHQGNIIIKYINPSDTEQILTPNLFDQIGYGTLVIFIMLATILTGFGFRSQNAGEIGFIGSTIIASLIKPAFFIIITILAIRFIAKQFNKIRSDD